MLAALARVTPKAAPVRPKKATKKRATKKRAAALTRPEQVIRELRELREWIRPLMPGEGVTWTYGGSPVDYRLEDNETRTTLQMYDQAQADRVLKRARARKSQSSRVTPVEVGGAKMSSPRGIGRADYAERREAKIERAEDRAVAKRRESAALAARTRELSEIIPMGQPILVGHYSEGRDRRFREKLQRGARKAWELEQEAEGLERSVKAARANVSIDSDDPEALRKLDRKLQRLERAQEDTKTFNREFRRLKKAGKLNQNDLARAVQKAIGGDDAGIRTPELIEEWKQIRRLTPYQAENGLPSYITTNRGAEIRRLKKRREELATRAATAAPAPEIIGGIEIREADNRVQLLFPDKPSADTRAELKSGGFRWSRNSGAWQRKASTRAWYLARQIAGKRGTFEEIEEIAETGGGKKSAAALAKALNALEKSMRKHEGPDYWLTQWRSSPGGYDELIAKDDSGSQAITYAKAEARRASLARMVAEYSKPPPAPRKRKDPRRVAAGYKSAERIRERQEFTEQDIPADLIPIFRKVRRSLPKQARTSAAEVFMEWVEFNEDTIAEMRDEIAGADVAALQSAQAHCNQLAERARYELQEEPPIGEMRDETREALVECSEMESGYDPDNLRAFYESAEEMREAIAANPDEEIPF